MVIWCDMTPQKWFVAKDYVKDVIGRSLICLKHDFVLTYLNTIELRCLIEDVPKTHNVKYSPVVPTTIKTMGVNITTIVYLRVLIIQIGSTIILMVVEAQGFPISESNPLDRRTFRWSISSPKRNQELCRLGLPAEGLALRTVEGSGVRGS